MRKHSRIKIKQCLGMALTGIFGSQLILFSEIQIYTDDVKGMHRKKHMLSLSIHSICPLGVAKSNWKVVLCVFLVECLVVANVL